MKILKDRITLCDLEPEVADIVFKFINELYEMLNDGLIIEGVRKFNTVRISDKFNVQIEMTRGDKK